MYYYNILLHYIILVHYHNILIITSHLRHCLIIVRFVLLVLLTTIYASIFRIVVVVFVVFVFSPYVGVVSGAQNNTKFWKCVKMKMQKNLFILEPNLN